MVPTILAAAASVAAAGSVCLIQRAAKVSKEAGTLMQEVATRMHRATGSAVRPTTAGRELCGWRRWSISGRWRAGG